MVDSKIKILIADDFKLIRKGLSILLNKIYGLEVVGDAENGRQAVELTEELQPDVIIMDVNMPVMDGVEATRKITMKFPDIKVIAFTSSPDRDTIEAMLDAGASKYLIKGCGIADITSAINELCKIPVLEENMTIKNTPTCSVFL